MCRRVFIGQITLASAAPRLARGNVVAAGQRGAGHGSVAPLSSRGAPSIPACFLHPSPLPSPSHTVHHRPANPPPPAPSHPHVHPPGLLHYPFTPVTRTSPRFLLLLLASNSSPEAALEGGDPGWSRGCLPPHPERVTTCPDAWRCRTAPRGASQGVQGLPRVMWEGEGC